MVSMSVTKLPNKKVEPSLVKFKTVTKPFEITSNILLTKGTLSTSNARTICKPNPIPTNRQSIFFLSVLKINATSRRKAIPSKPRKMDINEKVLCIEAFSILTMKLYKTLFSSSRTSLSDPNSSISKRWFSIAL